MILDVAYGAQITRAAQRWGLDPTLLAAVAAQETGGPGSTSGRNVVGDGGHGHGLFQIDDRYHAFARSPAAMDPWANADYAAHMLHDLIARCGGDVHAALSAYNAGSPAATGTLTTWADGKTLGYADSVERHQTLIGGARHDAALRDDVGTEIEHTNALSSFAAASAASPVAFPQIAASIGPSLAQMQRTDDDGARLISDMFDDTSLTPKE
jgi:hypothetical protein